VSAGRPIPGPIGNESIRRALEDREIEFVQLWFTDVLGFLKSFSIPPEELPEALEEGVSFDGSAIDGFARVQEADMVARPDPATFTMLPWRPGSHGGARMFCDIHLPDGSPFPGDPRGVLRRTIAKAAQLGFTFYAGPEIEFFLFRDAHSLEPLDDGSYFDLTPVDVGSDFRRRVISYLERLGLPVKDSHHEVAASQHEVDLRHADALTIADSIMTFRLLVKEVAQELGIYATFMPKPIQGAWGSGMHTHLSLFEGDRNAFFDPTDEYYLSKVARSFIAGLLTHAREISAITNQWVNSYKRLVPGFEAPVHVCWGVANQSALVRVPLAKPGKESACRAEYRAPDPACNPYLALAVMLAAGLRGVEMEYELPREATDDIHGKTDVERWNDGIESLPESLPEALAEMQLSELVRETLGEHLFEWFVANKRAEWDEYRSYVTQYETDRSLPRL
jgi:glutamine synthetase